MACTHAAMQYDTYAELGLPGLKLALRHKHTANLAALQHYANQYSCNSLRRSACRSAYLGEVLAALLVIQLWRRVLQQHGSRPSMHSVHERQLHSQNRTHGTHTCFATLAAVGAHALCIAIKYDRVRLHTVCVRQPYLSMTTEVLP
jgi:hypothetical protein